MAQPIERPSKVQIWCNSNDVGSKHAAAWEVGKNPSRAIWQPHSDKSARFRNVAKKLFPNLVGNGHADFLVLVLALLPTDLAALGLHDHGAVLPDRGFASLIHLLTRHEPAVAKRAVPGYYLGTFMMAGTLVSIVSIQVGKFNKPLESFQNNDEYQ